VPCTLEQRLALDREVSVLVARNSEGQSVVYPLMQNHHVGGILDLTIAPAEAVAGAQQLATTIAVQLGYIGVLAVEMFVVRGHLLVNELAPRPHNSGHWTLDACVTSQFEQQVRAVCGLGLGATDLTAPGVAMANLLGDLWTGGEPEWSDVLTEPRAKLHLYGKAEARPGRKMGHLTVVAASPAQAGGTARRLRDQISVQR
jgi:5-(carboxyamino)imidazole ribonucleotide synthase